MLGLRVNQTCLKILTFAQFVGGDFIMRPSTLYAICSSEKGDHILKVVRVFALYVSKEQAYKLSDIVKEP